MTFNLPPNPLKGEKDKNSLMINYPVLSQFPELLHFCTTRHGGVSSGDYSAFNISPYSGDSAENQQHNLRILAKELKLLPQQIVFPYQTHSDKIRIITDDFLHFSPAQKTEYLNGIDALITNVPTICVGVTTADCVPILIYDAVNKAIAVAHAGWRGTCARIVQKTLQLMHDVFGTKPNDVYTSIGVSISPDVYEVGGELIVTFENANFPVNEIFIRRDDKLYLDLWNANKWLLLQSGVPESQIEIAGICSFKQSDNFFSARKFGLKSGRMLSGIMLK